LQKFLFILLFIFWGCDKSHGSPDLPGNDPVEGTDTTTYSSDTIGKKDTTGESFYFYIGTYTDSGSKGIYKATFNTGSGTISIPELAATINNPSFQCISKDKRLLWTVTESGPGSVTGFQIDTLTGNLTKTETFSSLGYSPCYVSFDEKSLNVFTANYNSGNITKIPVTTDGKANGKPYSHQHVGKGPNANRQEGPHAHCIKVDPRGKYIYSCDLGTDKIYVYTVSGDSLTLYKTIAVAAGSGPRHLDFHPQLKSMAVIHELDGTITTYLPDADGCFSIENNTVSTLPDDFSGQKWCADIHYSIDGKFLYGSNRGHNSIACYKIDNSTQQAEIINWQSSNIKTPRNFAIDPTGNYLLSANQDGNTITVFKIDKSGTLSYTGFSMIISKPVCITFLTSKIIK